jgi:hypothetical protein
MIEKGLKKRKLGNMKEEYEYSVIITSTLLLINKSITRFCNPKGTLEEIIGNYY